MNKWRKMLMFLFVFTFIFGAVQGFGQISSADQKDVWKKEETFHESFKNGDLKGHMALWHKDAQLWPHSAEGPQSKLSVENYYESQVKFKIDSYKLGWPTINIFGNTAIVYFDVTIEGYLREPPYSARVIHIWMKQDNKWQLIGGMYRR